MAKIPSQENFLFMIKLLLLASIALSIWYWRSVLKRMPREKRQRFLWSSVFWGVLLGSLLLVATGKMHWVGAGLAALVPLCKTLFAFSFRAWPLLQFFRRFKTEPSQFRTQNLHIEINFANQSMDGTVLAGDFADRRLSELNSDELNTLKEWLSGQDRESNILLSAYMLRAGIAGQHDDTSYGNSQQYYSTQLSEKEALEILGLETGVSHDEIVKAHKRLVQRLHPDRGGSDYLAAKINAAKDTLLS